MKKYISVLLSLILCFSCLTICANAEEFSGTVSDNIYWSFDDTTGTLTISGTGDMPEEMTTTPWLAYNNLIKTVVFENGITSVSKRCFEDKISITTVIFADTITKIGESAFSQCSNLSDFNFPENIEVIEKFAFNRTAIESVVIPKTVKELGAYAFSGEALKSFVCYENVTYIQLSGKNMTELKLSDSVTEVHLIDVDKIKEFALPQNVKEFSLSFWDSLEKLVINDGVTDICDYNEILDCPALKEITIPRSVRKISNKMISPSVKIYCYPDTTAHAYALKNGNEFELLGESLIDYTLLDDCLYKYLNLDYSQYTTVSIDHLDAASDKIVNAYSAATQAEIDEAVNVFDHAYKYLSTFKDVVTFGDLSKGYGWLFDGDKGILIISGSCSIQVGVFNGAHAPWDQYYKNIYTIIISDRTEMRNDRLTATSFPNVESVYCCNRVNFNNRRFHLGGVLPEAKIYCSPNNSSVIEYVERVDKTKKDSLVFTDDFPQALINDYIVNDAGRSISGIAPLTPCSVLEKDITAQGGTVQVNSKNGFAGTGASVTVTSDKSGRVLDEYVTLVYGDINGDAVCDAQDAMVASMISAGLTDGTFDDVTLRAADCNHDGVVDSLDVQLLNQAGVLLAQVDQTLSTKELQASSAYIEYSSLISQTPEITDSPAEPEPEPEENPQPESPETPAFFAWLKNIFKLFVGFVTSIFKF